MLPQTDSGNFTVNVKLPVGTALEVTDAVMRRAEHVVLHNPDVQTVFSAAGSTLTLPVHEGAASETLSAISRLGLPLSALSARRPRGATVTQGKPSTCRVWTSCRFRRAAGGSELPFGSAIRFRARSTVAIRGLYASRRKAETIRISRLMLGTPFSDPAVGPLGP